MSFGVSTVEDEGKLPVMARAFVLEMAPTGEELIKDRVCEKLGAKEEVGEAEVLELGKNEMGRLQEEVALAVEILQKAEFIEPRSNSAARK